MATYDGNEVRETEIAREEARERMNARPFNMQAVQEYHDASQKYFHAVLR